jgi:hypothetical protein
VSGPEQDQEVMTMKWKMIFVFLTGFFLHELMVHVWLAVDGQLPLTSDLFFGIKLTSEINTFAIAFNSLLVVAFGYLGLVHDWHHRGYINREA